jgi:hypothetical protein
MKFANNRIWRNVNDVANSSHDVTSLAAAGNGVVGTNIPSDRASSEPGTAAAVRHARCCNGEVDQHCRIEPWLYGPVDAAAWRQAGRATWKIDDASTAVP